MFHLPHKLDVYITNVCNLTCDQCNRFNNHDFRGWQRWSDYEAQYQQWASVLKIPAVTIMGGEPFLNPTLPDWVKGISDLFAVDVQILTNGTRFRQAGGLYDALLNVRSGQIKNHIAVSLHRSDQFEKLKEDILWFLKAPVEILTSTHENNHHNSDWCFRDSNDIVVNVYIKDHFHTAAIRPFTRIGQPMQKTYLLHNSDPFFAHQSCGFAIFKSYHFVHAKLYKCGPVALMPEFDQQHTLAISSEDRTLLNSYLPLTVNNFDQYHEEFFENLDKPIAQCKFCPTLETITVKKIFPLIKGQQHVL